VEALARISEEARRVWAPPPDLTVSQWAEENLRLSAEDSAEPGRYTADRAPYQRGILDAFSDYRVQEVVVMSSAQVGKTTLVKAVIGYFIDQDPSPILCLQPTVEMAQTFSKDRLAPMMRDTPALQNKIAPAKSRDSGNTVLHKRFPGGHITLAGSNSPPSLSSRPIRVVLMDEVDRYPASAGSEGDPVNLAKKRTTTFKNRKILLTSMPTDKGISRIEAAFETSDQRYLYVPCPHCGHKQRLTWSRVQWPDDRPDLAAIACEDCGATWSEAERQQAIRLGEWRADKPFNGTAGFHLSELYSPWSTPAAMARAFLEAKQAGVEQLKTWVNTALGEPWEEEGEVTDARVLLNRREEFTELVPLEVEVLTMGVDVQADRLEAEVVGWDYDEQSWSVDYLIEPGDTSSGEVWERLAEDINARYTREDGRPLHIELTCIDSGYIPKTVYEFCFKQGTHVIPIKGVTGARPIVESGIQRKRRLMRRARDGVKPEIIGVDEAKIVLHRRLAIDRPGPGYCHFPQDRDEEFFYQLTAEKLTTRYVRGRPVLEWVPQRARNEALDCRVYAHAALLLHWGSGKKKVRRGKKKGPALPTGIGL
jgi:phage terminase large subunit GpA-like protein